MSGDIQPRVEAVLAAHEARWTTHGETRYHHVIHCALGSGCDWSLRQKALMSDDDCYEAHRAHVAAVIAADLADVAGADGLREPVEGLAADWDKRRADYANTAYTYAFADGKQHAAAELRAALAAQPAPADDEGGAR